MSKDVRRWRGHEGICEKNIPGEGTDVAKALRGAFTAVQGEEGHRVGGGRDC